MTASLRSFRETLRDDAVGHAFPRFSAAKCVARVHTMRAPFHGARVARACAAHFAALNKRNACLTASSRNVSRKAAQRC
eukprot:5323715-Lingulodinium_polyedra.AAC.1